MERHRFITAPSCLLTTLLVTTVLVGCRSSQTASAPQYLIDGEYNCFNPPAERLSLVQGRIPSGFITGYAADQMPVLLNRIALIPDRDTGYLFDNFKAGILRGIAPSGGGLFGIAGVTSLSAGTSPAGNSGLVAREIGTGPNQVGFALQHEIGHAVEILAADYAMKTQYKDFPATLTQLQGELSRRGDVRSYAKSSPNEAWAEAYSNFYCSPESNDFIKSNLPFAHGLLRAVLVPPIWEASPSDKPPLPQGDSGATGGSEADGADGRGEENGEGGPAGEAGKTFSDFLDRVVELLTGGQAGGSGEGPGSAQGGTASSERARDASDGSITVALREVDGATSATALMISTSKRIKRISLCIGTIDDCSGSENSQARKYQFDEFKAGSGRNFFSLETVQASQEKAFDAQWHILGYDAQGGLVAERHVQIVAKTGRDP